MAFLASGATTPARTMSPLTALPGGAEVGNIPQLGSAAALEATTYNNNNHDYFDRLYSLLAEDVILSHAPVLASRSNASQLPMLPKREVQDWPQCKAQLARLGFYPESEDPWILLGLHKLEGPDPNAGDIVSRQRSGTHFAHACMSAKHDIGTQAQAKEFICMIEGAASKCIQELPQILRERKQLNKNSFSWRWMEVCPEFLHFLNVALNRNEDGVGGWKMALHMSNLLQVDLEQYGDSIVPLGEAQQLYRILHSHPSIMGPALKGLADKQLVLWAPTDNGKLLNLFGELLKIAKGGDKPIDLKLIVTYDPIVGCEDIDTLLELWHHISLNQKYKPIIKGHTFFDVPMRCVVTGGSGPLHVMKSMLMVHICGSGEVSPPIITPWKNMIISHNIGPAISLDFPTDSMIMIQECVNRANTPGLVGWDVPRRSPAHSPGAPRHVMVGYFNPEVVGPLELTLLVKDLRSNSALQECMIGSQSLLNDTTSYVVDCGDINILSTCHWLLQEVLVISKRRVIMTSLHPKHTWEQVITQQAHETPSSAITSIKFRKRLGMPASLVWLKPLILQEDLQRSRQQAGIAMKSKDEQTRVSRHAHIRIEGLPHVEHDVVCVELMTKVAEILQIPLGRAATTTPGSNEWSICYTADGEFAQKIAIQFDQDESIQKLVAHVHGCGVKVGGKNLVTEVKSLHPMMQGFLQAGRNDELSVSPPQQDFLNQIERGGPCL